MSLPNGVHLGPYEILAPIGAGGMGEVYRARDSRLDRDVAIKVLPERLSQDLQALARFEREAKAVAALSHPNVVAIHDVGEEKGVRFVVTELLEGETLRSRLRSAIPWRKAVDMGIAVADGLAAAHAKGITHRDLKPENIFLTSDGRVKILDFGLARVQASPSAQPASTIQTETEAGMVMGTVGYMSPEQVRGEPADASSDIFSLGCVLYEMLAGRRPFARETAVQTMAAILDVQPPPAGSGKEFPADLDRVVARCLEKNRPERFQSAHDLALALRTIPESGSAPAVLPVRRDRTRNVALAGVVVALLAAASLYYWINRPAGTIDSLGVLPFVNAGGDPNMEYLSDGITENLINSFSQLPKLRVVPRSRAFRYKGRESDTEKIGKELNVRAVLTGRIVQRGDTLNIQAELVDIAADSQLWGQQYNRKLSEIIPVQEEIAKEVAVKLRLRPTDEEQKRMARRYTANPEAHQLYLKGRYFWNRRTREMLKRAADNFQQAIDKDPAYALAWAGLADVYAVYAFDTLPPSETIPKATEAVGKALAADETLAEAHATLGFIRSQYDWDWRRAEQEFKRAIELDPSNATARQWYSNQLEAEGRSDEAIAESKRALETDPVSMAVGQSAGRTLYFARRYDQAIEQLHKTVEIDPNFPLAHWVLGMVYEQLTRYEDAVAELNKAVSLSGGFASIGELGHAYAIWGKSDEARKVMADLKDMSNQRYVAPLYIALIYAGLGDKTQALDWLEKARDDHSLLLIFIKLWPQLDGLRKEPRFQALVRRMGLQP